MADRHIGYDARLLFDVAGAGDEPAVTLHTRYGGRAGLISLVPIWTIDGRQIYQSMTDYYFECAYTSIPQCQMSASGRNASCVVNPYYAGPKGKRSKPKPPRY